MISRFIQRYEERKAKLEALLRKQQPSSYLEIFKMLIETISDREDGLYDREPDVGRIDCLDHGHYQGTLVFIVAACGYQPSTYWATTVSYGSCSVCDTLEALRGWYDNEEPYETCVKKEEIEGYMTLALHLLQNLRKITPGNED